MDRSTPGSSVHGILHRRIQTWVAIPFSRGSSNLDLLHYRQILYRLNHHVYQEETRKLRMVGVYMYG